MTVDGLVVKLNCIDIAVQIFFMVMGSFSTASFFACAEA